MCRFEDAPGRHLIMANSLLYPSSKGSIHVTSATDVFAAPDLDLGYLTRPNDLVLLKWAYKKTHEIIRRLPSFVMQIRGPTVASEKKGLHIERKDLVYTPEDDERIEEYIRENVDTTFHPWYVLSYFRSHILVARVL
jgi:alcohol oxidase